MDKGEWFKIGFLGAMGVMAVAWWTEGSLSAIWLLQQLCHLLQNVFIWFFVAWTQF